MASSSSSSATSRNLSVLLLCLVVLLSTLSGVCANHDSEEGWISWRDVSFTGDADRDSDGNRIKVIYVSKNGDGHSTTVQGAVDMVPENNQQRVKIVIFGGIYRERVVVPENKPYISFIGNPYMETVITYNAKASDKDVNGKNLGTFRTATVEVNANYFAASGITIENSIVAVPGGVGMQAVALKVTGDYAFFYSVRLLGSQDTLLDLSGKHYYYRCYIEGLVDFICGNGRSLFKDCVLHSTAVRSGAIAAQRRDNANDNTGFSFVNCTVYGTGKILLGRAWGPYSRTIYSYCNFANIIDREGWSDWGQPERRETVSYGEYNCTGRGANRRGRVPWSKRLTYSEAQPFLTTSFIDGDQWLRL